MKKQNSKAIIALGILTVLCLVGFITIVFWPMVFPKTYITNDVNEYKGRAAYFDVPQDYYGHLLIFPELTTKGIKVDSYFCKYIPVMFESHYEICLECTYDADGYEQEKQRLKNISMEYKGEKKTIAIVDGAADYSACIATWMDNSAYEYALLDDNNRRIVYLYAQIDEVKSGEFQQDYILSEDVVENAIGRDYSIYFFRNGMDLAPLKQVDQ